jgi:Fe(3+) dicitrate transport protein
MRTDPGQGEFIMSEMTDAHVVFDMGASYKLHENFSLFASVVNISDKVYVVARRPAGIRPGMPRAINMGVKATL